MNIHYLSGSHWDREWYRPFQEFRFLLVEVLDDLIELIKTDDNFKFFHLDGQTCILNDYLEIRPEKKKDLEDLIQSGKILIGPWFTMPDLFSVGEESLIRNLLLGKNICSEWNTKPMPIGYVCDMFGHPSKMPQIFNGFGYKFCVLGRGTIEDEVPAFFIWKSKDESSLLVYKLQDELGYGAFSKPRNYLEAENKIPDPDKALEAIKNYVDYELKRTNAKTIALFDSMDHMPPATDTNKYINLIKKLYPDYDIKHSNLIEFFNDAYLTAVNMPEITGELRKPSKTRAPYNWLIPNCPSARIRLKQKNDFSENLLLKWSEPFLTFANFLGAKINTEFINHCWTTLLLNHAHDSICGCSIDQVHKDMDYRFDQVLILGESIKTRALGKIAEKFKPLSDKNDDINLLICNPTPYKRNEVVSFYIDFPLDYPAFYTEGFGGYGSQKLNSFKIYDETGNEILYHKSRVIPKHQERTKYLKTTTEGGDGIFSRYFIEAELELPPVGLTSFVVKPSATPVRNSGSMLISPFEAENEFLRIKINPNGTLNIYDKTSKENFDNLLLFEDISEIGSGWFHSSTLNEKAINSLGNNTQISITQNSNLIVTFNVEIDLKIPQKFDLINEIRTEEENILKIINQITLKKNSRFVQIKTLVNNRSENHLLKLLLPTNASKAEYYSANTPFDIITRKIKLNQRTESWQEQEILQKPFLNFVAVSDSNRGLAFISGDTLHEGGVRDDYIRSIEITLLRSFNRTVGTLGERDGLEIGDIEYNYVLLPFTGNLPVNEIFEIVEKLKSNIFCFQSGKISSGFPKPKGKEISNLSFLEFLDKNLILSAVKPTKNKNEFIIRVWNPVNELKQERIQLLKEIIDIKVVNLAEEELNNIKNFEVNNNILTIFAKGSEIITLKIKLLNYD